MKFGWKPPSATSSSAKFDELRARLEAEVERPAVIAITSSMREDGKELAARGLAYSFANTGYPTLLVDTSTGSRNGSAPGLAFEEIGRQQSIPGPGTGYLATLSLSDPTVQRTTNQRGIKLAFDILRAKFNYVLIDAEFGADTSFATSVVTAADAVLVTVKTGRRTSVDDAQLATVLDRIGDRFLGLIAMDKSILNGSVSSFEQDAALDPRRSRNQAARQEKETQRRQRDREIVESST